MFTKCINIRYYKIEYKLKFLKIATIAISFKLMIMLFMAQLASQFAYKQIQVQVYPYQRKMF